MILNANHMLIRLGYDIGLRLPFPTAVIYVLHLHPARKGDLVGSEDFRIEPELSVEEYFDGFGNHCGRVNSPAGVIRFLNHAIIRDPGTLDSYAPNALQHDVRELPLEPLFFLLPSRYCEVDSELLDFAWQPFGATPAGWPRVEAICDFFHGHLCSDYLKARANRTALDGFRERVVVCREFTHLAITLCRCMNIPARYATGYLGDVGIPALLDPMDFSAGFEVYLVDRWCTFDARHNKPRIGRIVMARGRDASDVALTTVFGSHLLEKFSVITEEIDPGSTANAVGVS